MKVVINKGQETKDLITGDRLQLLNGDVVQFLDYHRTVKMAKVIMPNGKLGQVYADQIAGLASSNAGLGDVVHSTDKPV